MKPLRLNSTGATRETNCRYTGAVVRQTVRAFRNGTNLTESQDQNSQVFIFDDGAPVVPWFVVVHSSPDFGDDALA